MDKKVGKHKFKVWKSNFTPRIELYCEYCGVRYPFRDMQPTKEHQHKMKRLLEVNSECKGTWDDRPVS